MRHHQPYGGRWGVLDAATLDKLRDGKLNEAQLSKLVLGIADDIVAAPKLPARTSTSISCARCFTCSAAIRASTSACASILRPRADRPVARGGGRARPQQGRGAPFEIIESLGRLMWTVDRAAMVFCIDQVEDLRFFDDPNERFQKAARDLIQIVNRVPTSIALVSCLGDFYDKAREVLAQSYIDRIEKAGPERLVETRTAAEARLIIAKRLQQDGRSDIADPTLYFGPQFFEEFSGLSTRRILELAQARIREQEGERASPRPSEKGASSRRWRRRSASVPAERSRGVRRSSSASCGTASRRSRKRKSLRRSGPDGCAGCGLALARDEWGGAVNSR
jgi:hypothetical protein